MRFKIKKINLGLIIIISFFSFQLTQVQARDIFKKPTAVKKVTTAIKKTVATTTNQIEEAKIKELMDILNRNATVTYPLIEDIGQLKQAESKEDSNLPRPSTSFDKFLPYSLGLIVLLILVIIIFLWRWINQKSKLFFDQRQEAMNAKPVATNPIIKPIQQVRTFQAKPIIQETPKKMFNQSPTINEVKPKIDQAGVLNLKDLSKKPKGSIKKNRFV